MAALVKTGFSELPENIILEIFRHLSIKQLCTVCRVSRSWRRVANDNSLWRHVNLLPYRLNLSKMWKVIRGHFSNILLSLHIRGFYDAAGTKWRKMSLSDAMLKELQERCSNIEELELTNSNIDALNFELLPPNLKKLVITRSGLPYGWFKCIEEKNIIPNIEHIDLSYSIRLCDEDMKHICTRKTIQVLIIQNCYRITITGVEYISTLPHLKILNIPGTGCCDLGLHKLGRSVGSQLIELRVDNCDKITSGGYETVIALFPALEKLSLCGAYRCTLSPTEESLLGLQKLKKLKTLDIHQFRKRETEANAIVNRVADKLVALMPNTYVKSVVSIN
ncbi:unnamed protein product [Owenia fusiformis]|uniref:Uncharacterized protein n=1 Tax=Owenia fusiformis TaxID=6347 RepID=A0A8J1XRX9_OWEFU|nr:unnamed protein product [Owenia fusiformis]